MKTTRSSGILLHPTALPGPYGIGDLGPTAQRFIDTLAAAGQKTWQILPLSPTGWGESPYSALSAFALNPLLISPEDLAADGDLPQERLNIVFPGGTVDFGTARPFKEALAEEAASHFFSRQDSRRQNDFVRFCRDQAGWLDDYTLFCALRAESGNRHWRDWPEPLRDRDEPALTAARLRLTRPIQTAAYIQFALHESWERLRSHARARGVRILGDLPIFVAEDSADVWAHRDLFDIDTTGQPRRVAGVPPDYFSPTGQRWGNPLYDWQRLAASGYAWWLDRLRRNLELYDLIRIDHFRGFAACWSIPADEPTAVNGRWEPVPGRELFLAARDAFGSLPVVAEDLGVITPDVTALRDEFNLPGMKILQFAFDSDSSNPYLPHNYTSSCIVYTGTHDNDTTAGWWNTLPHDLRANVERYLGYRVEDPCHALIRTAAASVADLCIIPAQDLLGLPGEARFNRPGEAHGNWQWRLENPESLDSAVPFLLELGRLYGR